MSLHGAGFIVTQAEAEALGLGKRSGLEKHIRPYRNGRDLMATPRGVKVIDLFGLEAEQVRMRFPEVYQHLLASVKGAREAQHRKSPTRDAKEYLDRWWLHGKPREELRPALASLPRYIATVETAKHRVFQFLDASILPDNMLLAIGSDDGFTLGVLSSRVHVHWTQSVGGTLEDRPRYTKSHCFDPFPFPECSEALKARIRAVAEELDAHRKARQAEHPRLTLTQMYNVLEKLRAKSRDHRMHGTPDEARYGAAPLGIDAPSPGEVEWTDDDEKIKTDGLILILKELHEKLDALVFEAYGWPATLSEEDILERLVALNKKRSLEEKVGIVKWLRPEYQVPRFGSEAEKARLEAEQRAKKAQEKLRPAQGVLPIEDDLREMMPSADPSKPRFPTGNELAETASVMRMLAITPAPLSIDQLSRGFQQGRQVEKRVALTILALARLGHIASPDGGQTFMLRRVG